MLANPFQKFVLRVCTFDAFSLYPFGPVRASQAFSFIEHKEKDAFEILIGDAPPLPTMTIKPRHVKFSDIGPQWKAAGRSW